MTLIFSKCLVNVTDKPYEKNSLIIKFISFYIRKIEIKNLYHLLIKFT